MIDSLFHELNQISSPPQTPPAYFPLRGAMAEANPQRIRCLAGRVLFSSVTSANISSATRVEPTTVKYDNVGISFISRIFVATWDGRKFIRSAEADIPSHRIVQAANERCGDLAQRTHSPERPNNLVRCERESPPLRSSICRASISQPRLWVSSRAPCVA